jgi:hypothetical protein
MSPFSGYKNKQPARSKHGGKVLFSDYLLPLLFDPEDGSSNINRNVSEFLMTRRQRPEHSTLCSHRCDNKSNISNFLKQYTYFN